jgi:hypothetical protein
LESSVITAPQSISVTAPAGETSGISGKDRRAAVQGTVCHFPIIPNNSQKVNRMFLQNQGKTEDRKEKTIYFSVKNENFP